MENFTRIPNHLFDEWMKTMQASSFIVLMAICRKILGWNKESDNISLSQIEEITGLTRPVVIKAIKDLTKRKLIIKDQSGKINNYSLNISKENLPIQNEIVNNINHDGKENLPIIAEISKESLHTKESILMLEKAYNNGIDIDRLKEISLTVRNWTEFKETMESLNEIYN